MNIKKCNTCDRELPLTKDYFHVDNRDRTGFKNTCKECARSVFTKIKTVNKKFKKPEVDFDVNKYQNNEAIKKFKELYLEKGLAFNNLRKVTGLSVGSVHFLLDILGIRLTFKQLTSIRRENKIKEWNKLRPAKEELEKMYEEYSYSMCLIKKKHFPKIPHQIIRNWFKEYKIPCRHAVKYMNSEDRLKQIIVALDERKNSDE